LALIYRTTSLQNAVAAAPALLPVAVNGCHGQAADAVKGCLHQVVPVVHAAGMLPHSDQQLACNNRNHQTTLLIELLA
jgi:hypothetical protein